MQNVLKITVSGTKYVVETEDTKLHILSEKALRWNLKRVFGLTGLEVLTVMVCLDSDGSIQFDTTTLEKVA